MMEYFWRLYIHGYEECLVKLSSLIIFAFDPVVSLLLIIIFKTVSSYPYWNHWMMWWQQGCEREREEEEEEGRVAEGEEKRWINMMPQSFVSFIWKKHFHYYIFPKWKNWIYTSSFLFFFFERIYPLSSKFLILKNF